MNIRSGMKSLKSKALIMTDHSHWRSAVYSVISLACVMSVRVTRRACDDRTEANAAVLPSRVRNSTSKASPSGYMWTIVPTSSAFKPKSEISSVSTMRSCSSSIFPPERMCGDEPRLAALFVNDPHGSHVWVASIGCFDYAIHAVNVHHGPMSRFQRLHCSFRDHAMQWRSGHCSTLNPKPEKKTALLRPSE